MLETKRLGFFAVAIATMALMGVGADNGFAQLNEKKYERDATGFYKGKTTDGVNQYKTNGVVTFTGMPDDGQGKMRIPVKDGKLKTKLNDDELPDAGGDKAKFSGTEKKSAVRRNGKKIAVVANGNVKDGVHNPNKGKVRGSITDRGSKWVANVKLKGERKGTVPGQTNCYKAKAKGTH